MYEKNDLPKETIGGAGVFLIASTRFSRSDDFKLPTPCRPEGVEFCCFRGVDDHPITPLTYPQTHPPTLRSYIEIPIIDLDVGICPQLLHVRSTPFDWGCDYPKTPLAP
jgi:hypothetical protein